MSKEPLAIATKVARRILRSKSPQDVWTVHHFSDLPSGAVAKALSRLCEEGVIRRVSKGIYYRPVETILGASIPNSLAVAHAVAMIKGRHIVVSGHTGYNALGLTTQVAAKTTLVIDKPTRSRALKNNRIRTIIRPFYPSMKPAERWALDALRDINRISDTTPEAILLRLTQLLSSGKLSFERLVGFSLRGEPPRVRAMLGVIGERLNTSSRLLDRLGRSLNMTTFFKIKLGDSFPSAQNWKIAG
jgi:hypothetical protein